MNISTTSRRLDDEVLREIRLEKRDDVFIKDMRERLEQGERLTNVLKTTYQGALEEGRRAIRSFETCKKSDTIELKKETLDVARTLKKNIFLQRLYSASGDRAHFTRIISMMPSRIERYDRKIRFDPLTDDQKSSFSKNSAGDDDWLQAQILEIRSSYMIKLLQIYLSKITDCINTFDGIPTEKTIKFNPENPRHVFFTGDDAAEQQLREIHNLSPYNQHAILTAAIHQDEIGDGRHAYVFVIPDHEALVLRALHAAEPPDNDLKMVPVRYHGAFAPLLGQNMFGVPRAIFVPTTHPFSQQHSVTPWEALDRDAGVEFWILNRLYGRPPAENVHIALEHLYFDPLVNTTDFEGSINKASSALTHLHADKVRSLGRTDFLRRILDRSNVEQKTQVAIKNLSIHSAQNKTTRSASTSHQELLKKERLTQKALDVRIHKTKQALTQRYEAVGKHFKANIELAQDTNADMLLEAKAVVEIHPSHMPVIGAEEHQIHVDAQAMFQARYRNVVKKFHEQAILIAEMPLDGIYAQVTQTLKRLQQTPPIVGINLDHKNNTILGETIGFCDLDFEERRTRGSFEEVMAVLLGKTRIQAWDDESWTTIRPWQHIVSDSDRNMLRKPLQTIIDKFQQAAANENVSFNTFTEKNETFAKMCAHFDLAVPRSPSASTEAHDQEA